MGTIRGSLFNFFALIFPVEDNGELLRPDGFGADWSEEWEEFEVNTWESQSKKTDSVSISHWDQMVLTHESWRSSNTKLQKCGPKRAVCPCQQPCHAAAVPEGLGTPAGDSPPQPSGTEPIMRKTITEHVNKQELFWGKEHGLCIGKAWNRNLQSG